MAQLGSDASSSDNDLDHIITMKMDMQYQSLMDAALEGSRKKHEGTSSGRELVRDSAMKTPMQSDDPVDIISDESSSDAEDNQKSMKSSNGVTIDQPAKEVISEDSLLRRAQMYQEYMKQIPIPDLRGSIIPFTSWTGLAASIKQLYHQPLHYLTNIRLKQLDQLRIGSEDENVPLDTIIHPSKAEITIWLIEEVHRLTSSHHHLAKLWLVDPLYHSSIDSIFPSLS